MTADMFKKQGEHLNLFFTPRKRIFVKYVPQLDFLGTVDGQVWSLRQDTPDDDEEGLHGRN